jgi:signal transduction histidine kinase
MIVIACGIGVVSWQFLSILKQARMLAATDDQVLAVYRIRADVGAIRRRLDDLSKTSDISRFGSTAHKLRQDVLNDLERARTAFQETGTPIPESLKTLQFTIVEQFDAMHRLAQVSDWTAVRLRLDNQINLILDDVRTMVEQVDLALSDRRSRFVQEIELSQRRAQIILIITGLVALATALTLGLFVTRSIVRPVSSLKTAAHQFATGDFNLRLADTSKDELGEVSRAFTIAAGELRRSYSALKRSNEDLEQFAYAASHDLQEPLRTISAFSDLLRRRCEDKLTEEEKGFLAHLVGASERMRNLVSGILEYSRLASSRDLNERIATEEIVSAALQNLTTTIDESHAVVTHGQLPTVIGSRSQLLQLFQNLIANSIKYRRADVPPRIHITATKQDGMWLFCLEDNGIGIEARHYEVIFGMFKQLTRGSQTGVGMGLALSKNIVERHGGTIAVVSTVGVGSKFSFTLKGQDADGLRTPKPMSTISAQ